jgi:hypothetical protein
MKRKKSLLLIFLLTLITACNIGRTPSKIRLEKACDVKLPADIVVIKDEYQDMAQDYSVIFDCKLSKTSMEEFIKSIKNSKYYNSKVEYSGLFTEDLYVRVDSTKSVWCKTKDGYIFNKSEIINHDYWVWVDTVAMTIKYKESQD